MTYDRSDAREAQRNTLAIELGEVRRKLGKGTVASRGATRPVALTLALLAASPVLVGVARHGPERTSREARQAARTWALQTEMGRELLDTAPVVEEASETITMGPARLRLAGHDAEGDALTVIIISQPVSGRLTRLDGTPIEERVDEGEALYVPNPGFVGRDDFAIAVTDGTLTSEPAWRSVRVYEPPVAPEVLPRAAPSDDALRSRSTSGLSSIEITVDYLQRRERELEASERERPLEPMRGGLLPPIVTNADLEARGGR